MATDNFLPATQYAQEMAQAKILVNTQTCKRRIQLKGRVAQALSCGTFLLEQNNPESELYLKDFDVQFWHTTDELIDLIAYWLEHSAERECMAQRARAAWLSQYNPSSFTNQILQGLELP